MRTFLALFISLMISFSAVHGQSIAPRLQSAVETAAPDEKIAVIIELADRVNLHAFTLPGRSVRQLSVQDRRVHRAGLIRALQSRADRTQGGVREFLRGRGVEKQKHLWINNSIAAEVSPETIQQLAARPEVASVRLDALVHLPEVIPAATDAVEDNLIQINVPDLWALGLEGQGTVVALLDTGVDYLHPDLNAAWRGGNNSWFNPVAASCSGACTSCDLSSTEPCDFLDSSSVAHGTGVAGIIVGGNAGGTSIGVAPQAQWIAAKIFKSDETALFSDIHLAFQWVLDPDSDPTTDDAPDVVNSSWGLDPAGTFFSEFRVNVQTLKIAGIAAVFSAGNFGPAAGTDVSPANYPESIAVGSVGTNDDPLLISFFSSRGPVNVTNALYPDLVAPGFFIKTADYSFGGTVPNSYIFLPGTSFAAPHVAGIIALLTQAFPQAPLADIEDALTLTAQDLGALGPDNDYGQGLIDASAAYDWLIQAPHIAITDPVPPANDGQLDFGTLLLSTLSQQTVSCSNSGRGELQIGSVQLSGDTTFSLAVDDCSGRVLTTGQSCDLEVAFSSATAGIFAGALNVPSNDFNEPTATVTLQGIAAGTANPPPRLVITDTVAPTGDRNIPFGLVLVGSSRSETLQVRNDDLGLLELGPLDSAALNGAFSVTDGCSNRTLAFGESCLVEVVFAPVVTGNLSGSLSLPANDPSTPLSQITLSGTGNNPPPVPSLITPAAGGSNVSVPVNFTWRQLPDPDGESITNSLYVSTDPDFTGTSPIQIASRSAAENLLAAGFAGLLLAGWLAFGRKRSALLPILILAATLFTLVSCGGGGSSVPDPNLRSYRLSGLSSQTTYFWKVTADDGNGGTVESSVASFTTE